MTLTEAGAQLGLSPATLRSQIRNGALRGTMIGKTWTVTPREVERYKRDHMGRRGRPTKETNRIRQPHTAREARATAEGVERWGIPPPSHP